MRSRVITVGESSLLHVSQSLFLCPPRRLGEMWVQSFITDSM